MPLSTSNLTEYAIALHERGYACVPLREGSKELDLAAMDMEPVHLVTHRKRLMRTAFDGVAFHLSQRPADAATLQRWFREDQRNIGIVGGYRDLLILDFDNIAVFQAWRRRHEGLCAATPVERTPSGAHVFLRCATPEPSSSLHIGPRRAGHIKAYGGYVAVAPSRFDGQDYAWLEGQSPLEMEPQTIERLEGVGAHPVGIARRLYDRVFGRGQFEPDAP